MSKKREAKLESKQKKKGLDMADLLKDSDNEESMMPERARKRLRLEEKEPEEKKMIEPKCSNRMQIKVVEGGQ